MTNDKKFKALYSDELAQTLSEVVQERFRQQIIFGEKNATLGLNELFPAVAEEFGELARELAELNILKSELNLLRPKEKELLILKRAQVEAIQLAAIAMSFAEKIKKTFNKKNQIKNRIDNNEFSHLYVNDWVDVNRSKKPEKYKPEKEKPLSLY